MSVDSLLFLPLGFFFFNFVCEWLLCGRREERRSPAMPGSSSSGSWVNRQAASPGTVGELSTAQVLKRLSSSVKDELCRGSPHRRLSAGYSHCVPLPNRELPAYNIAHNDLFTPDVMSPQRSRWD